MSWTVVDRGLIGHGWRQYTCFGEPLLLSRLIWLRSSLIRMSIETYFSFEDWVTIPARMVIHRSRRETSHSAGTD